MNGPFYLVLLGTEKDVTLCSLLNRYQCFKGTCCLYLHGGTLKMETAGLSSSKMLVSVTTYIASCADRP